MSTSSRHENFPVDLIIISDQLDNRTKLKYLKMFYIETQGYVVASTDESSYNLFKVVEIEEGNSELHDIDNDDEWDKVNDYLLTHYKDVLN
ncbi:MULTISPECIES: DUF1292 domain-containing protein [unclassified Paenibacillus]|uniref:DUF1292 domain-containing protein n=1 Tax=Paenibacillus provencensis TaxID=441151 RepID=A0ABW3PYY9_9BACL|nr:MULTISPECIES: DUF1292 domain-containing protein [unclassified Paenibacillus]MCM3130143.1 DUF1292 domain-containing protein [Paenibacillus sp. MER 78]SDX70441.1 Protein of unknown function [Paenibacillus sp. PDC88]SFS88107.1 Protein of unknown function [Paenibacillus sp. 453mf]